MAEVSAVIIDGDGTTFDSLGIWMGAFEGLCTRRGREFDISAIGDTGGSHLATNHAKAVNRGLNLGATDEEICQELHDYVYDKFAHEVKAFPGIRDFMESLVNAGIPFVLATGTFKDCAFAGLQANGLDDLIPEERVFSCQSVEAGKERPDVYLAALEYLQTPPESTWVIEDEPWPLVTARELGMRTANIFRASNGRPESETADLCDVLVHGLEGDPLGAMRAWEG